MKILLILFVLAISIISCSSYDETIGRTEITKWPDDKKTAISITFDDGIINQLTVARPILNKLSLPATFYIITGKVEGSKEGKFIGRPAKEIINETSSTKTNKENFFERASLIAFTGKTEAVEYHSNAGSLFERGRLDEAYALIDEGYEKIRKGSIKNTDEVVFHNNKIDTSSWDDYKAYSAEGHEIASHTVTHARLAVLDEPNMLYELEQSKADIQKFLGEAYTFTAECPYGTENERVMEYAHEIYPALRNRMPEPYMAELNRGSKNSPVKGEKEYVQWQRGPLTNISMQTMKSWVDTCVANDNIWLVLVFHGVDGVGWEPKTGAELEEYFTYIKEQENSAWVATFADVTKYIRQRKNAIIKTDVKEDLIAIDLSMELDPGIYNVPLSLKTYVPNSWMSAQMKDEREGQLLLNVQQDTSGSFVLYNIKPGGSKITISKKSES